ncbi:hypothetical protein ELQ92_00855 [Labedella populi]|uniref:Uncharacterized protein n=2 Tax=Labedella populi TaxID=2498850 RepID=A0A3S3ZZX5_9MICO|nr:hypothetical protein ELQ92_00855 [Labedella populi]
MSSESYNYPVAISRLTDGERSREPQNARAVRWLQKQSGGQVVVVTPRREVDSPIVKQLIAHSNVRHVVWRGFSIGMLSGRVLHAWPNREHFQKLWDQDLDALAVIEWNEDEAAEWIDDANPIQLFDDRTVEPAASPGEVVCETLPNGVDGILEYVAGMAAGYSTGLKWNEEDKLKADMMNRPERWVQITVEQVRVKCRVLNMRPDDIDTIAALLQRRKEGRRFNVRSSYRTFSFS